jgi:hypothetical protein
LIPARDSRARPRGKVLEHYRELIASLYPVREEMA